YAMHGNVLKKNVGVVSKLHLRRFAYIFCFALLLLFAFAGLSVGQFAAKDPGVRNDPPAAGGPRDGLQASYSQFYYSAKNRFSVVDSVTGTQSGSGGGGLGPRFNGTSCAGCHIQPAVGGSSPAENPQIAMAIAFGGQNQVPSFITSNGPVREVRFVKNPDG